MQQALDRTCSAVPPVEIVEYQQSWPRAFGRIARELEAVMAEHAVQIEHIGSTAVPRPCATPVVDILMGVWSLAEIEAEIQRFAERGYRYRQELEARIPERVLGSLSCGSRGGAPCGTSTWPVATTLRRVSNMYLALTDQSSRRKVAWQ